MNPRAFIVHCWEGTPNDFWYPWLERELGKRGFLVCNLSMPDTLNPQIAPWVQKLKNAVGHVRPDDIFIGHSIGCQTIGRFLEKQLNTCSGVLFVAGWTQLKGLSEEQKVTAAPWLTQELRLQNIASRALSWDILLSDNDPWVEADAHAKIFTENLGANVHVVPQRGHFDNPEKDKTLPEALSIIETWGVLA